MSNRSQHPEDHAFQSYLEGELAPSVRTDLEAHFTSCAGCTARLDAWRLLLEELGQLPVYEPAAEFRSRVLAELPGLAPRALPIWNRVLSAFGLRHRGASSHLTPQVIQDLLDGVAGRRTPLLQAHLTSCERCTREFALWERLCRSLDGLGRLHPSTGFAYSVLQQVEISAIHRTAPSVISRVLAATGHMLPSTRRAWTIASAFAAAPSMAVVAVLGMVFFHPLLTVADLFAFVTWRVTDLAQVGFAWTIQQIAESSLLFQGMTLVQTLLSSPGVTLAGAVGVWTTLATAGWIFYRNVVAPPSIASNHG